MTTDQVLSVLRSLLNAYKAQESPEFFPSRSPELTAAVARAEDLLRGAG